MLRRLKILVMVLILSLSLTSIATAQGRVEKLLRGAVNTLTGWVEIPKNIYDVTVEENGFSGATKGTIQGFGMAVVRTGCGVYEVVTFPLPVPDGYEPILYPVHVFDNSIPATVDKVGLEGNKTYILEGDNEYEKI